MKYEVVYSDTALNDILNINRYISSVLLAPEASKRICNKIMDGIEKLNEMPDRNSLYEKEPWRSRGLRKLIVGNFLVFYLTMDKQKQVLIMSIMYGKRNTEKLLSENEAE